MCPDPVTVKTGAGFFYADPGMTRLTFRVSPERLH
jgi:hypothetical protein